MTADPSYRSTDPIRAARRRRGRAGAAVVDVLRHQVAEVVTVPRPYLLPAELAANLRHHADRLEGAHRLHTEPILLDIGEELVRGLFDLRMARMSMPWEWGCGA